MAEGRGEWVERDARDWRLGSCIIWVSVLWGVVDAGAALRYFSKALRSFSGAMNRLSYLRTSVKWLLS